MIEYIPELVEAGINSFKIEGRMKPALYVAVVAGVYREAIDDYFPSFSLTRARARISCKVTIYNLTRFNYRYR